MSLIIYQKYISRNDLIENRDKIYLFGDNDLRQGMRGQALEMRGERNSVGIRVKKRPGKLDQDFYNDLEYEENCKKINEDFSKIPEDKDVVIPSDGIGTGLAELKSRAPKTFEYLELKLKKLTGRNHDR